MLVMVYAQDIRYGRTNTKMVMDVQTQQFTYYLNFSGSSSYFAERWTETVERKAYVNGKWQSIEPIVIDRKNLELKEMV